MFHALTSSYLSSSSSSSLQAVKLESLRAGRTRYLVVVSRPVSKSQQLKQSVTTDTVTSHSINSEIHHPNSNSISLNPTSYFNEAATTSSGVSRLSANLTACDNNSIDDDDNSITTQCPLAGDDSHCETESNVGSSCSRSSSNEIEESCLLGIDCNEKTTVGLVLRVLADTAIRLDGDG
jgi:protein phosphatase slingshot